MKNPVIIKSFPNGLSLFLDEEMSFDKLLEEIVKVAPNFDYIAYYPDEAFYDVEKHIALLPERTHNYVYKAKEECIYALLDEVGVKNALI